MKIELQEPDLKPRDERAVRQALTEVQHAHPDKLLTAEATVEAASDDDSPLHSYFLWDDSRAAAQYRLAQARALIRHITVTMPDDKEEAKLPKYVSLQSDRRKPGGGYRETRSVLNSKEMLAELEETARKDIDGVLRRFEMLKSLVARVRKAAGIRKKR